MATGAIDRKVEAVLDRYAAIDWRQPAFDPAGIRAAYQRWQAVVGLDQPIRLAGDPVEAGIWRLPNEDRYFVAAESDLLAAAASADNWVQRYWVDVLAGRIAMHPTVDRLYPEVDVAARGALPPALSIEWDVAAGWASLIFLGNLNGNRTWSDASARHIAAGGPALLRAMNFLLPFGSFSPWGPPAATALGLRNLLAACGNTAYWARLAQTRQPHDEMLAPHLLHFGIATTEALGPSQREEVIDAAITLCEPMLAACESGAFAHVIVGDEIVVLTSPSIWTDGRRLHRTDGPAVAWRQTKVYAWKGVFIPEQILRQPRAMTLDTIRGVGDVQLQGALVDIYAHAYGHSRCMQDLGGVVLHEDGAGRLWCIDPNGDKSLPQIGEIKLVEVVNGTSEPDGSRKIYWLRVPPWMRTAQEAVAWTYGITPDEYDGLVLRT
jgi:hypothetical protein